MRASLCTRLIPVTVPGNAAYVVPNGRVSDIEGLDKSTGPRTAAL
jgi:hypothetical protein